MRPVQISLSLDKIPTSNQKSPMVLAKLASKKCKKVLDVEVMSKECRGCMNHRKDEGNTRMRGGKGTSTDAMHILLEPLAVWIPLVAMKFLAD